MTLRRGLIDDVLLILCLAAGLLQRALRGDRRKPLVPGDNLARQGGAQLGGKFLRLFRGWPVGAVHVPRHSDNDGFDFTLGGQLANAFDGGRAAHIDRFQRMREETQFVADRHSDANVAKIDAEHAFHCG